MRKAIVGALAAALLLVAGAPGGRSVLTVVACTLGSRCLRVRLVRIVAEGGLRLRLLLWIICLLVGMGLAGGASWADTSLVLSDLPEYQWFHGCGITAAGMMIGYWDAQPGFSNLFTYGSGDASTQGGDSYCSDLAGRRLVVLLTDE